MHILIIPSWYPSSSEDIGGSFFREQALALAKHNDQVGLIFPALRSIKNIARFHKNPSGLSYLNDNDVHTYRWNTYNWTPRIPMGIHRQWLHHGQNLFELYIKRHGKPDVIHAHCMLYAGALATHLRQVHKIPVVLTEHSSGYGRALYGPSELKVAKEAALRCDYLLAVSNNLAQTLDKITPGKAMNWSTIPNIVNGSFINYPLNTKLIKKQFTFLNVGLLGKIKRQELLVRSFAKAFPDDNNIHLWIAGDGPEKKNLLQLINELNLNKRVSLLGSISRSHMPHKFSEADAFVLSSELETFGVVVIEALAMGLPVISTLCGGPNDLIQESDGMLVPVDDAAALAEAMRSVYLNIEKFNPMEIKNSCRKRFGENAVCEVLTSIYQDLASYSARTGC